MSRALGQRTGENRVRTDLHEAGATVFQHPVDGVGKTHRLANVAPPVCRIEAGPIHGGTRDG